MNASDYTFYSKEVSANFISIAINEFYKYYKKHTQDFAKVWNIRVEERNTQIDELRKQNDRLKLAMAKLNEENAKLKEENKPKFKDEDIVKSKSINDYAVVVKNQNETKLIDIERLPEYRNNGEINYTDTYPFEPSEYTKSSLKEYFEYISGQTVNFESDD